jgi:transcriptional regulator with XRE-family HTH domain
LDDLGLGRLIRMSRIRRGWRQQDLATACGLSRGTISRIERGHLQELSIGSLRRVSHELDIRVELLPRSRLGGADRLTNARHAALAEFVVAWLGKLDGWTVRPEVSFAFYADRGIVDVLGWHQIRGAVLIVELKTEMVDVGELLGTLDRKRRVARQIAGQLGWHATQVGVCLLVADSMTNRRRVESHGATLRAAFPGDGRNLRRWLGDPVGELRAMRFVSDARQGRIRSTFAAPRRIATRRRAGDAALHRPIRT